MSSFILDRRQIINGRVATMGIVPAFEEDEDRLACFWDGAECDPIEEFTFEGGKETLAQSVVITVAHRPHRGEDARFATAVSEG
jgi:hypothetical protein